MNSSSLTTRKTILVAAALLLGFAFRLFFAPIPNTDDDISLQTWSHLTTKIGLWRIYDREENQRIFPQILKESGSPNIFRNHFLYKPDPYLNCNFPPGYIYILKGLGVFYQRFISPTFDETTGALRLLIILPAIFADVGIALLIFLLLAKKASFKRAYIVFLLYLFNPATIYMVGYSAKNGVDSTAAFFMFASIAALVHRRYLISWLLFTIGMLIKPQCIIVFPIIFFLTWRERGLKGIAKYAAAAGLVTILVSLPFIYHGRLTKVANVYLQAPGHHPVGGFDRREISLNAYNIWWLFSGGKGAIPDTGEFLGILNYRAIGLVLFALAYLLIIAYLGKRGSGRSIYLASAAASFFFFMLPTEMAERYLLFALPALLMIYLEDGRFRILYLLLSATFFVNLYLVFPFIPIWPWRTLGPVSELSGEALWFSPGLEHSISLAIAFINVNILIYFLYLLLLKLAPGFLRPFRIGKVRFLGKALPVLPYLLAVISLCVGVSVILLFRLPEYKISQAHFYRGLSYLSVNWQEEATAQFTRAVALDPENIAARFQLGNLYRQKGDFARAKIEWQEILRINPSFQPARRALEKLELEGHP